MYYFIVNPNSHSGRGRIIWDQLHQQLLLRGISFQYCLTRYSGHATKIASEASLLGIDSEPVYMIAIGALISVPLSKKLMDAMYPVMVSNIACGMNLSFTWQMYALIYAGIIITYLVINKLLVRKIYKVGLSDALKNRE